MRNQTARCETLVTSGLIRSETVKYEVLREHSEQNRVLLDIAVVDEVFSRELVDRLARQLAKELANKTNAIVNIFDGRHSTRNSFSHRGGSRTGGKGVRMISAWYARYVKSREIGLPQLTIHAGNPQLRPEVIRLFLDLSHIASV